MSEASEKPISDIYFSQSAQADAPMDESDGSAASPADAETAIETAPEDVATEPTLSESASPSVSEVYDESDGASAVPIETSETLPPASQPIPQSVPTATHDNIIPAIIAASIADAFFNKEPTPTTPPPVRPSCDPTVTLPPAPILLLRDVQTDADLTALRTKYRNRYLELEEMLEYASATAKLDPLSLSLEVKKLKKIFFYESPDYLTVQALCEAEADMEELYSELAQLIYPATLQTLRATSENYPVVHPWWSSWFLGSNSAGLNFFRQIFWVAMALIAVLFFREYISFYIGQSAQPVDISLVPSSAQDSIPKTQLELFNRMLQVITPFLYGAIGSLIYVYKTLSDLYVSRTLDPNKLANNWMRLFMGSLMGGLTVALFYQGYFLYDVPGSSSSGANDKISAIALAFLTGYSVEFFYRILDRAINVLVPKSSDDAQGQIISSPRQQQMETLLKRLKDAKSEDDKALIRSMLEKL